MIKIVNQEKRTLKTFIYSFFKERKQIKSLIPFKICFYSILPILSGIKIFYDWIRKLIHFWISHLNIYEYILIWINLLFVIFGSIFIYKIIKLYKKWWWEMINEDEELWNISDFISKTKNTSEISEYLNKGAEYFYFISLQIIVFFILFNSFYQPTSLLSFLVPLLLFYSLLSFIIFLLFYLFIDKLNNKNSQWGYLSLLSIFFLFIVLLINWIQNINSVNFENNKYLIIILLISLFIIYIHGIKKNYIPSIILKLSVRLNFVLLILIAFSYISVLSVPWWLREVQWYFVFQNEKDFWQWIEYTERSYYNSDYNAQSRITWKILENWKYIISWKILFVTSSEIFFSPSDYDWQIKIIPITMLNQFIQNNNNLERILSWALDYHENFSNILNTNTFNSLTDTDLKWIENMNNVKIYWSSYSPLLTRADFKIILKYLEINQLIKNIFDENLNLSKSDISKILNIQKKINNSKFLIEEQEQLMNKITNNTYKSILIKTINTSSLLNFSNSKIFTDEIEENYGKLFELLALLTNMYNRKFYIWNESKDLINRIKSLSSCIWYSNLEDWELKKTDCTDFNFSLFNNEEKNKIIRRYQFVLWKTNYNNYWISLDSNLIKYLQLDPKNQREFFKKYYFIQEVN